MLRGEGRRVARGALAFAVVVVTAGPVAAGEIIGEVDADLGVGVTDNATSTAPPNPILRDELFMIGGGGRVRYHGARVDHALGYQGSGRWYLEGHGPSGFAHNAAWQTTAVLTQALTLDLGATVGYARSSIFQTTDVRYVMTPMLVPLGDVTFMNYAANEALSYEPSARWRFGQAFMASRIQIIDNSTTTVLPETAMIGGSLRAEKNLARDQYNADLTSTYMDSTYPSGGSTNRSWVLVQGLVGWRREVNVQWSVEGRGGAVGVFLLDGLRGVVAPAFQLNAAYKRDTWFANFSFVQTATPNPYYANTALSDALLARAALPLTHSERYFFTAFASYVYGRSASSFGQLHHIYDTATGGATLTARSEKLPVWASLDYTFTDQRFLGGDFGGGHLQRQQLMLTVGGAFIFGKGQPSPFRGVL